MKKEVSAIIREDLKDPRLGFVTVTSVVVSNDLSDAKIYVSVYGDQKNIDDTMEALQSALGFIRREIGSRIRLRIVPEIRFIYDESMEHGAHINQLLEKLKGEKSGE